MRKTALSLPRLWFAGTLLLAALSVLAGGRPAEAGRGNDELVLLGAEGRSFPVTTWLGSNPRYRDSGGGIYDRYDPARAGALLRKLAEMAVTLLLATLVLFVLTHMAPGDPVRLMLGEPEIGTANSEAYRLRYAEMRRELRLDDNLFLQYGVWLGRLFRFDLGRSIHTRRPVRTELLERLPATLQLALPALSATLCLGVCAGMAAGILGGLCDAVLMRIVDVLMAFPFTVLALVVTALFGTGFLHLLFAVAAVWWVPFARLARSITLSSGNDTEVAAARVLGASGLTIAVHEILPKVTGPAWVLATFELGKLILSFSALSFFGLGAKPPSPEWGTMLADAKVHFFRAPHLLLGPALFIFLTVLSLNLMGEGLRDRLDPFEIPGF